jgi:hypothetical protein
MTAVLVVKVFGGAKENRQQQRQVRGSLHCAVHDKTVNSFGRDDGFVMDKKRVRLRTCLKEKEERRASLLLV